MILCSFNTLKDTSMLKIKKLGKFLCTDICPTFAIPCIYTYKHPYINNNVCNLQLQGYHYNVDSVTYI